MDKSALDEIRASSLLARHELARAIGYFSIEFADMESKLNALIHELLGLEPDTGHALTSAIMNVSTRLDILTTLSRELESAEPYRKALGLILADVWGLNAYRNWLLHDNWAGSVSVNGGAWEHQKQRMRPAGKGRKWQHESFTEKAIIQKIGHCTAVVKIIQPMLAELSMGRLARKENGEKAEQE